MIELKQEQEKVILVAVSLQGQNDVDSSLDELAELAGQGLITLPQIPVDCRHNGHIFFFFLKDKEERDALMHGLNAQGIGAAFHYIPLHSSKAGKQYGRFHGEDNATTAESERLLRLPLYFSMTRKEAGRVVRAIYNFFEEKDSV